MFQEPGHIPDTTSDAWKIVPTLLNILLPIASSLLTFILVRPKNRADIHKTEADAFKTQLEIIRELTTDVETLSRDKRGKDKNASQIVLLLDAAIREANRAIELANQEAAGQAVRMKLVLMAENLYKIQEKLEDVSDRSKRRNLSDDGKTR
jgi:hypothetical protein